MERKGIEMKTVLIGLLLCGVCYAQTGLDVLKCESQTEYTPEMVRMVKKIAVKARSKDLYKIKKELRVVKGKFGKARRGKVSNPLPQVKKTTVAWTQMKDETRSLIPNAYHHTVTNEFAFLKKSGKEAVLKKFKEEITLLTNQKRKIQSDYASYIPIYKKTPTEFGKLGRFEKIIVIKSDENLTTTKAGYKITGLKKLEIKAYDSSKIVLMVTGENEFLALNTKMLSDRKAMAKLKKKSSAKHIPIIKMGSKPEPKMGA